MHKSKMPETAYIPGEDRSVKLDLFGEGEWMDEPDYMAFTYRDTTCQIFRNSVGSLCGYVSVPEGHKWHGVHYDIIDCDVHGGLTFSEHLTYRHNGSEAFIIGFDCSHSNDISPSIEKSLIDYRNLSEIPERFKWMIETRKKIRAGSKPSYKNIAYVKAEIERLVDQMLDGVKSE